MKTSVIEILCARWNYEMLTILLYDGCLFSVLDNVLLIWWRSVASLQFLMKQRIQITILVLFPKWYFLVGIRLRFLWCCSFLKNWRYILFFGWSWFDKTHRRSYTCRLLLLALLIQMTSSPWGRCNRTWDTRCCRPSLCLDLRAYSKRHSSIVCRVTWRHRC